LPSAAVASPRPRTVRPTRASHAAPPKPPKPRTSANPTPNAPRIAHRPAGPGPLEQGYTALTTGQFDLATSAYRRALQINNHERDALLGLAYIAERQNRPDEARELYQRVLRQEPENTTAKAALLARLNDSEPQKAGGLARELAEKNPQSSTALATLGSLMAREGRLAEAQQAFFKAVALEPDNALYTYNLAVALDRLHKPEQAVRYYTRAVALADKTGGSIPREAALQRIEQLHQTPPDNNLSRTP
jgi:Flp pilus assembly protein TadD